MMGLFSLHFLKHILVKLCMDICTLDLEFSLSRNLRISFLEPSSRFSKAACGIWDMVDECGLRKFQPYFYAHVKYALNMENTSDQIYERRLKKDIQKLEQFLAQAETAESLLYQRLGKLDPKVDAVALDHAASKLSYIPEKGDVIGIATASVKTEELVNNSRNAYTHLKSFAKDRHELSETYRQLLDDYEEVVAAIDTDDNPGDGRTDNAPPLDIALQLEELDRALDASTKHEQTLSKHLKRLVVTFLMTQGWDRNSSEFKVASSMCIKLVEQLVQAAVDEQITEQPVWVNVRPDSAIQKFITQLMLGDMIYVEDTTNGVQRVRLREYGL